MCLRASLLLLLAPAVLCLPSVQEDQPVHNERVAIIIPGEEEVASVNRIEDRLRRARRILSEVPLVDGHNDLPYTLKRLFENQLGPVELQNNLIGNPLWEPSVSTHHTDIPRLRQGMVGGQFWSAYIGCNAQYKDALRQFLEQIDVVKRLCRKYPDDFEFVTSAAGILKAHSAGRIAGLIGVEGGHAIDSSLAALRVLYEAGTRYMTLTHGCNTPWADNSKAEDGEDGWSIEHDGLSAWGEIVIKEMNRLGMFVDISHVASQTMRRVLDVTRAPVIFSHSSARALCNHTRNVPDDVLHRMKKNGGVVMVNFYPKYITCSDNATIDDVVDHINYIRDVAGVDHVGIGGDYNGITYLPTGLEDVSTYPDLFAALMLDPRWTDDDLKKLAGINVIRALFQTENVRDSLNAETPWDSPIPMKDIKGKRICAEDATPTTTTDATLTTTTGETPTTTASEMELTTNVSVSNSQ